MDYLDGLYADECKPIYIDRYDEGLTNCHVCDNSQCNYYYDYHDRPHIVDDDFAVFVSKLNESLERKYKCKSFL